MNADWGVISPEPGKVSEVGKLLQSLADDGYLQVGSTTDGPNGFAFTADPVVYARYLAAIGAIEADETVEDGGDEDTPDAGEVVDSSPVPVKRGPGRPRKNPAPVQES